MPSAESGYIAPMTTPGEILSPTGRLAARIPRWESRPQQVRMAELVAAAIRDKRHLFVEAGTGVGKSLAYLSPAVASGLHVVVATATAAIAGATAAAAAAVVAVAAVAATGDLTSAG